MSGKVDANGGDARMLEEALERGESDADPSEVAEADRRLDDLLDKVETTGADEQPEAEGWQAEPAKLPAVSMCTGYAVRVQGRRVVVRVGGRDLEAELGAGVSRQLVEKSVEQRERVLLEQTEGERPRVVGIVRTTIPDELTLEARKVTIEGDEEVLLRSGRGAMRIRQDGDVELVGSRIAAMSRGLFRLVGRVLRLN